MLLLSCNFLRVTNKFILNIKLSKMYTVEPSKKPYHLLKKSKKNFKKNSTTFLTYLVQSYKFKKNCFVFKKKVNYMKRRKKFI